jgi:hypothetical protein
MVSGNLDRCIAVPAVIVATFAFKYPDGTPVGTEE